MVDILLPPGDSRPRFRDEVLRVSFEEEQAAEVRGKEKWTRKDKRVRLINCTDGHGFFEQKGVVSENPLCHLRVAPKEGVSPTCKCPKRTWNGIQKVIEDILF